MNTTRRAIIKGAAWSAPIAIAVSSAPALAASTPDPCLSGIGFVMWNLCFGGEESSNKHLGVASSGVPTGNIPSPGVCMSDALPTTVTSGLYVTYWLPVKNVTFSIDRKYHEAGWSKLKRDTSVPNKQYEGVTYRAYTTRYSGTLTGNGCAPTYAFISNCPTKTVEYFYIQTGALVDGEMQIIDEGPLTATIGM